MTADIDTRWGELYPPGDAVLPDGRVGSDNAAGAGGRSLGDAAAVAGFGSSRERFEGLVGFLDGTSAAGLSHAELEERLDRDGRELLRRLLDDHLALRAIREPRLDHVINLHPADAVLNLPVERHSHGLRQLAGLESARGSFEDAVQAIERAGGQRLGHRQVQALAATAAKDFEDFYATRRPSAASPGSCWCSRPRPGDRDAPRRATRRDRDQGSPRRP